MSSATTDLETTPRRRSRPSRRARLGGADGPDPERTYQAVKLPRQVRLRLRMWAGFLDKEISELVEEAITTHLDALDHQRERRGLQALPQPET